MSKTEKLLSELRGLHVPSAPESMSLWLIAANIGLLIILVGIYLLDETWRRAVRRDIQHALNANAQQGLVLLAKLLRKSAILRNSNQGDRQGEAWLEELDAVVATQWFTQEQGQIFGTALYENTALSNHELTIVGNKFLQLVNTLPSLAIGPATRA